MKPNSKKCQTFFNAVVMALGLCVVASCTSIANAQFDSGEHSLPPAETLFDDTVRQADFQSPANRLTTPGSLRSLVDNKVVLQNSHGLGSTTRAAETEPPASGLRSDFFQIEAVTDWIASFRHQFAEIQLPKVLGSLGIVLGGYFAFVWFTRKLGGVANGGLPSEVVEVLGHAPFGPRKSLQLVRLGSKLLLLMNDADGTRSIGEITDPHEVDYLTSLCGSKRSSRSAIAIRKASADRQSATHDEPRGSELSRVLRQLERSSGRSGPSSVFDA